MGGRARIAVVQHEDICPPGVFARWLGDAGADVRVHRPYLGEDLPVLGEGHGLIVLGGGMSAGDDDRHSWLAGTRALLRRAVARGVPTLGICLGHQLLAEACGGRVERNPAGKQMGLLEVGLTPAGRAEQLFGVGERAAPPRAIQWNDDIVTALPRNADLLAATVEGVPQAIRCGQRAWGLQFHPEATAAIVDRWVRADGSAPPPGATAAIEAIRAAEPELVATWRPLAQRFVALAARTLAAG